MTSREPRLVGERFGLRLVIVHRSKPGVGDLIVSSESARLISGVEIEPLVPWPDDRGNFIELFRFGEPGIARDFVGGDENRIQVSITTSYPGVIKAVHYHFQQTDLWAPVGGMLQVILCDLRDTSPSCGQLNTLFVGRLRPWKLRIPPGVAHGYRVIGTKSAQLIYATNRLYNPDDEGRIAFDDPDINYDWSSRPR
jgi:dTDP-4-dehydrorhamnose 3,5-epimerase